jgi:hypothetical protein
MIGAGDLRTIEVGDWNDRAGIDQTGAAVGLGSKSRIRLRAP